MTARFVSVSIGELSAASAVGGVHGSLTGDGGTAVSVVALSPRGVRVATVRDGGGSRFPGGTRGADVHLRVDADCPASTRLFGLADVLIASVAGTAEQARRRTESLLTAHPGCLVTVVPLRGGTSCVLGAGGPARSGTAVLADAEEASALLWPTVGSFLHGWLCSGGRPEHLLDTTLLVGGPDGALWVTAG